MSEFEMGLGATPDEVLLSLREDLGEADLRVKQLEKALHTIRRQTQCEGADRTLCRIAGFVDRVLPPDPPGPAEARTREERKEESDE